MASALYGGALRRAVLHSSRRYGAALVSPISSALLSAPVPFSGPVPFGAPAPLSARCYSSAPAPLLAEDKEGVRTLTMNDPKTRNALSSEMLTRLLEGVTQDTDEVRCVVIRAEGPVFSSGHNLKHIHCGDRAAHTALFSLCGSLMLAIRRASVPVLAAVGGRAAAAGCQLVAACDLAVAADTATFSTPGAAAGIFCSTPGIPLVRCMPRKAAAHLLLTGAPITAEEALRGGLVSSVVPAAELDAEVERTVSHLLLKSRAVLALGKRFMYQQAEMTEEEAYRAGTCVMVDNIAMEDGREGIEAFVGKRRPVWRHK